MAVNLRPLSSPFYAQIIAHGLFNSFVGALLNCLDFAMFIFFFKNCIAIFSFNFFRIFLRSFISSVIFLTFSLTFSFDFMPFFGFYFLFSTIFCIFPSLFCNFQPFFFYIPDFFVHWFSTIFSFLRENTKKITQEKWRKFKGNFIEIRQKIQRKINRNTYGRKFKRNF